MTRQLFGVDLAELVNEGGKELIFNEFGCGGGASVAGDRPARTIREAAEGPFFGVYGAYTRRTDPFRNYLPGVWEGCVRLSPSMGPGSAWRRQWAG